MKKSASLEKVHVAIDQDFDQHLEKCRAFLKLKSVSVTGEGIRETAERIKDILNDLGAEVSLWGNPSFPIVYSRLNADAEKTLIIYGMYDVQPAEERNWMSPPFEAEIHNFKGVGPCVIARGAYNSKGVLCGLFNVLETIKATDTLPVNLIFTIEGEEEVGSPQFENFIRTHRDELRGFGVVDFDFLQDLKGKVALLLGLKGIVCMDVVCRGGQSGGPIGTSLHGSDSAWVASPVWRLIHALSSLTDRKENIKIAGLNEAVAPPGKKDLKLLKNLSKTFDETAFLKEMKSLCFKYERSGVELLKKGLYSPIININGFKAGYTGSGTKTVLPRKATAKIDIRFGPNLEPEQVVEYLKTHFDRQGYADIEIIIRDAYTWAKTDFSERIVQKMLQAYRLHNIEPEVWPMSTFAAPHFAFQRILDMPVVCGGLGHGGRAHVSNEYMSVAGLKDFEKFVATLLYTVAAEE
ncbi:MAG: M20/M25/M40 family metallo-hydrolase [Desulfobacterales bacterium]|jgi:acetylornithine deacetylase/succinyl-diaminopimelate desuccinylase-like protein